MNYIILFYLLFIVFKGITSSTSSPQEGLGTNFNMESNITDQEQRKSRYINT